MSKLQLKLEDLQHGPKYDAEKMRRMQNQLNAASKVIQKLLQLLRDGSPGQVLTKTAADDLIGTWADATGGGSIDFDLEEGTILGRADGVGTGPPQQIEIGANLVMTGDVLSAVVPVVPPEQERDYPRVLGHAGI